MILEIDKASALAEVALQNIHQEYPNKLDHVLNGAHDLLPPSALHPVFFGSFDWHSCVHMHWSLVRLLRLFPQLPQAAQIRSTFAKLYTEQHMAVECAYLKQPSRQSFERSYGWAWLLKLQTELDLFAEQDPQALAWAQQLQVLSDAFLTRYLQFLPLAQFPIRAGTHANSAFGLLFALQYTKQASHPPLQHLIISKAQQWFAQDQHYPARFEPGGDDFLSGGLIEAVLMAETMEKAAFTNWWQDFCSASEELAYWTQPVAVSDRTDPKMSHLDGLNLSRAWCWRVLQDSLPAEYHAMVEAAIERHLQASIEHAFHGDYVGTHWLASFVLLALTELGPNAKAGAQR